MKKQWVGLGLAVVLPLLPLTTVPVSAQETEAEVEVELRDERVLEGRLGEGSHASDRGLFQVYPFEGQAGERIAIDLIGDEFNPVLGLLDAEGNLIAQDDDGDNHARIVIELPTTARYFVAVAALKGEMGKYRLSWRAATVADVELAEAENLNDRAVQLYQQGKFAEAIPLAEEVLEKRQRLFKGDHPDVARSLHNLATLFEAQGRFEDAEPLHQQALVMFQRLFEEDHPDVAQSLNNLANLHQLQGKLGEAETLYKQALTMRQRFFEEDHPDVASSLNNLATLYETQGRLGEAETLFQEALEMFQRLFEGDHPDVATSLNNLALLYQSQGRLGDVEPLYQEALAMRQRLFAEDHPDIASSLNNLAFLYQSLGRFDAAEPLHQQALEMFQRLFGGDHPTVAQSLSNLAKLYQLRGELEDAEPLYQEALAMRQRLFAEDHPDIATSLNNSAIFYQVLEDYPQALAFSAQGAAVEEAILTKNLRIGSEQQKRQFLDLFQGSTNSKISFHLQTVPNNSEAARLALATILRRKGRVLDAMGQALQTLRDQLDPASQELFTQLASTQTQLAALASRPLPADTGQREQSLAEHARLDEEIRRLEAELSSRSAEFRQETTPVTIEAVQAAIPQDGALVEFIQYHPFNPKSKTQLQRFGSPRYAAYVLQPNGTVQWRDLGEAAPIDAQIQRFRTLLSRGQQGFDPLKATARELDQLLMAPVREMTGDASHLLLSPDSSLNLLPFAALVDEGGQYLVQNYHITYLTSGRDLLRTHFREHPPQAPLVLASPAYGSPGTRAQAVGDSNRGNSGDNRRSGRLATLEFGPLPGTKVEGEALASIVPDLTLLMETEASENSLKGWQRPQILHLATHGFFLEPEEVPLPRNSDEPSIGRENPLLRSGLALAGFNQRQSEGEDGVLTALEVTGLNLRGTRLVVLSACETGLGDIAAGEGVYGLRRAFTLAGAESQLMSLWEVSDDGTQELMVAYYQRLQAGEGRGEALRQVQLEMLQNPNRAHPFFWAAFIPTGAWTPIE